MTKESMENRLFRDFVRAILDAGFSERECVDAAAAMRDGRITDRIATFLDSFVFAHPAEMKPVAVRPEPITLPRPVKADAPERKAAKNQTQLPEPDFVFDLVKRRKVTKANLYQIFSQVDPTASFGVEEDLSMRESLRAFRSLVTDEDWKLLIAILDGSAEIDPYLRSILDR